jgi:molecular chaperone DnaJ
MRQSVAAVALIRRSEAGQALWLAQWNPHWRRYNFVAGHKRPDESFRQCVVRELAEELGLREGADISVRVPITVPEATLGAKIEVPTLWGPTTIRIPPGTRSGQKFRIREQGAPLTRGKGRGDQYAEVYIVPPPFEDQRVREMMKELERISGPNPRDGMGKG